MRLQGEVALITGASRGIGRAIALRFAREGATVAVAARTENDLNKVADEVRAQGGSALALICDVGEDASVRRMVAAAEKQFGKIDLLVNNAGYFCSLHPIEEMPDAEWDLSLRANL